MIERASGVDLVSLLQDISEGSKEIVVRIVSTERFVYLPHFNAMGLHLLRYTGRTHAGPPPHSRRRNASLFEEDLRSDRRRSRGCPCALS